MPANTTPPPKPARLWPAQAGLVVCLLLACWVGLVTRSHGFLAPIWPANAIMLGILLRHPALGKAPSTWLIALLTFFATDGLTSAPLFNILTFNLANVTGVFVAWLFLHRFSAAVLNFQRQRSVGVLFIACFTGAFVSTLIGAWASHVAFELPLFQSTFLWMSGEFFSFILFVPLFMAAPKGWIWQWQRPAKLWESYKFWPLVGLAVSEAFALVIGGPGAIAFLMPAMVWFAMSYSVLSTAILNVLIFLSKTAFLTSTATSFSPDNVMDAVSYRTGLALLSLAPLAVACAYALRLQALATLSHAVNHDFLTGTLARRALMERGQKLVSRLRDEGQPVAVLMADLDNFKEVNDRYGHAQGDTVLQEFAALARDALRPEDLLGRIGGEEFVIVLPRTSPEQALAIANRLCERTRQHVFAADSGAPLHTTISVGLHAVAQLDVHDSLERLLFKADKALYTAKNQGRNQVRPFAPALAPSTL